MGRVSRWATERVCDYGIVPCGIVVDWWSCGRHQVIGLPTRDGMELLVGVRDLWVMAVTDRQISPDDGFNRRNDKAEPWGQTMVPNRDATHGLSYGKRNGFLT